ncbi:MAG: hypothetical protein ACOCZK_00365 [Planctomycetota bacterium]
MRGNTREMERLVRQMKRQKVEPEYIRHYLLEEYQADPKTVDIVFQKVGLGQDAGQMGPPKQGGNDRFGSFFS